MKSAGCESPRLQAVELGFMVMPTNRWAALTLLVILLLVRIGV